LWPNELKGARTISQPIHIVDLFPTLVKLAGGTVDSKKPMDGLDVWPAIADDKPLPSREIVHNVFDSNGRGAIRKDQWKLVVYPKRLAPTGVPLGVADLFAQLFDIDSDPNEQNNLAEHYPKIVESLWKRLREHGKSVGDSRPYCAPASPDWEPPADWSEIPE
jgi:arylsulfatase A-like enzyme